MPTHKQVIDAMLNDAAVRAQYDAEAADFALPDELLGARQRAGLTQAEVAQFHRMNIILQIVFI
jgi:hypothetical protein